MKTILTSLKLHTNINHNSTSICVSWLPLGLLLILSDAASIRAKMASNDARLARGLRRGGHFSRGTGPSVLLCFQDSWRHKRSCTQDLFGPAVPPDILLWWSKYPTEIKKYMYSSLNFTMGEFVEVMMLMEIDLYVWLPTDAHQKVGRYKSVIWGSVQV